MNGYKKIVVPYDGSTHAQLALDHAASLAKVTGGTLIILYVASLTSAMTRISGFFGSYDAGAELIVMGSRGLGTFAGVALGSVSTYVLEHAKIPVIVVK